MDDAAASTAAVAATAPTAARVWRARAGMRTGVRALPRRVCGAAMSSPSVETVASIVVGTGFLPLSLIRARVFGLGCSGSGVRARMFGRFQFVASRSGPLPRVDPVVWPGIGEVMPGATCHAGGGLIATRAYKMPGTTSSLSPLKASSCPARYSLQVSAAQISHVLPLPTTTTSRSRAA